MLVHLQAPARRGSGPDSSTKNRVALSLKKNNLMARGNGGRSVTVVMKHCSAVLMIAFAFAGCSGVEEVPASPSVQIDFCSEIETIATSRDFNSAMSAYAKIVDGGRPAIDVLREYLADERTIPGTFSTRSFNGGTVRMADQSFFLIQDMIEPHNWKRQDLSRYAILTSDNLEQWLDRNPGKSITGLRIQSASTSLNRAKQAFEMSGSAESSQMIQFYRDRLTELHD